ncbi:MAG: CalY family protein [Firmicutes bacterium]|nr:CalY family protein [Bacillota bacterium]
MKKRVLMSMLVLALAVALIAGATMAWFTDTVESDPAVFQAGTVQLEATGMGHLSLCFNENNWNPGDTSLVGVAFQNVGSKKLKLRVNLEKAWEARNLSSDNVELSIPSALRFWWQYNAADGYYYYKFPFIGNAISPGVYTVPLLVEVTLSGPNTGNEYQGEVFNLSAVGEAVQFSHNAPWDALNTADTTTRTLVTTPEIADVTDAEAIAEMEALQAAYDALIEE